jgi:taurine dioxygenase
MSHSSKPVGGKFYFINPRPAFSISHIMQRSELLMDIKSLPPFAAEIDLDLSSTFTEDVKESLRTLYDRHHMLIFRNQSLSKDEQTAFMSLFGPIVQSGIDGGGYVTNEPSEDNILAAHALAFHSDLAFSAQPVLGISLYAEQVEDDRSSTFYVDSMKAYARLPDELRARVEGLHALHVYGANLSGTNTAESTSGLPRYVRPLVMPHPRSGVPILYINQTHTARIIELEKEESDTLLSQLLETIYRADNIYEHSWRIGDLVIWDNLALQHARPNVADVGIRRLRRVVNAHADFLQLYPEFADLPRI